MKIIAWIIVLIIIGALVYLIFDLGENGVKNEVEENTEEENSEEFEEIIAMYNLDAERSTLEWSAARIVGNSHTGEVALKSGVLNEGESGFINGSFVIDMTQISESEDNEQFLGHIRSDDFFSVEQHSESKFEITSIKEIGDGRHEVTGNLTIKDKTNSITFEATLEESQDELNVSAEFEIDRTRWDINFDSGTIFQQLGDKAIKDEVKYKLDLVFVKS